MDYFIYYIKVYLQMLYRILCKIKDIYYRRSSRSYINYLRSKGVAIGNNVILRPNSCHIDLTRPSLITIGDNVILNDGITLLTHDFVTGVFRELYNDFLPSSGGIIIGNNVRFGHNVTVLKGVTIGDNCFIGAGSIVSSNIPANSVANGNPCKVVSSIESFYKFRKTACIAEAFLYAQSIVRRFHRKPVPSDFWEEFPLFVDKSNIGEYPEIPIRVQLQSAYDEWIEKHKALYPSFESFLDAAMRYNPNKEPDISPNSDDIENMSTRSMKEYVDIYSNVFNVSPSLVINYKYKQSEGWDSVGHMSLVAELEKQYGIVLKPEDFFNLHSFNDGISILSKYGIIITQEHLQLESNNRKLFDFTGFETFVAIKTKDVELSYGELSSISELYSSKLRKGKLAFLLAKNTIGSILCYVSCVKNRIPVAILDAYKDQSLIKALIESYHPEYLMIPSEMTKTYGGSLVMSTFDYNVVHLEDTQYDVNPDLALMLTTSGSTGSPKFVRLSIINITSNANSIAKYLDLSNQERPITSLPMYYSYGISVINSHLLVGATIILTEESVVSSDFWDLAKSAGATSVSGVPYTYNLFRQSRVMDMDIPSLKTFTQAGGKMCKEDVEFFAKKCKDSGRRFIVMYGQTEASPRISYLPFDKAIEKSDSIGIPIPDVELWVSDDGELICKGTNVFLGYAESYSDLSKGDEMNGILKTGDMARSDADGYFYIIGRKKRFIKVYGNRIGLDELEQLIMPQYGRVVCVGVDDHITIVSDNAKLNANDIIQYVSTMSKINKLAFSYKYVEKLPYNDAGKIQYRLLEAML